MTVKAVTEERLESREPAAQVGFLLLLLFGEGRSVHLRMPATSGRVFAPQLLSHMSVFPGNTHRHTQKYALLISLLFFSFILGIM
jgi:hypothetical protein